MASMSAVVSVAAVPTASLRKDMEITSVRSSPAPSSLSQKKPRQSVVVRASGSDQEESWTGIKSAAAAAALALVLSASPAEAKGSGFGLQFPDNERGEASREILAESKKKSDASFAEAQKTGKETTGQAASAGDAQPAISQVDPNAPEASDSVGDAIATRADAAADLAPQSGPQSGGAGTNPIVKAFATPQRGLGDKEGENKTTPRNLMAEKPKLPGNDQTYGQNTGISEKIYQTFKSAGEGRDAGVGTKPQ